MAFNLEDKVKWTELSPSLQQKFIDLQDAISDQHFQYNEFSDGIRWTVGDTPPFNPKNNAEMWFDTKYKVIRAYASNNWEFTRAAWYGGDQSGITPPPTTDNPVPDPDIPTYEPKTYTYTYLTHNESQNSVTHQYNEQLCTIEEDGSQNVRYVFQGTECKYRVQINVGSLSNTAGQVVCYLLGVTGANTVPVELGTAHLWKVDKGVGNIDVTNSLNDYDWCIFDTDSPGRMVVKINPGDKPNDTTWQSTYFPADFPYRYPISTWTGGSGTTPAPPTRNYPTIKGSFSITVTVSCKY